MTPAELADMTPAELADEIRARLPEECYGDYPILTVATAQIKEVFTGSKVNFSAWLKTNRFYYLYTPKIADGETSAYFFVRSIWFTQGMSKDLGRNA